MPIAAPAAPAASPAPAAPAPAGASSATKPSAQPVKPNPVGAGAPAGQTAPKPQPTTPPSKQKWTDKVDGKEVEFEATEEDLRAAFRHRSAADRRFEEAAQTRREAAAEAAKAAQLQKRIGDKNEWLRALREANPDLDPTEYLAAELQKLLHEEEQLQDPNIRERRRLETELGQLKAKQQDDDRQRQEAAHEAEVTEHQERWAGLFTEALKISKLPVNDITMSLMAQAQHTARQRGFDLTPEKLAAATYKSTATLIESMLTDEATTDDQLLDAFPKLTARVHRGIVARYKAKKESQQGRPADLTPRARPNGEAPSDITQKPRTVTSKQEHEAYGIKGLRSL